MQPEFVVQLLSRLVTFHSYFLSCASAPLSGHRATVPVAGTILTCWPVTRSRHSFPMGDCALTCVTRHVGQRFRLGCGIQTTTRGMSRAHCALSVGVSEHWHHRAKVRQSMIVQACFFDDLRRPLLGHRPWFPVVLPYLHGFILNSAAHWPFCFS